MNHEYVDPDLIDVTAVRCRHCGAEPGKACIGEIKSHRVRFEAARKKYLRDRKAES